MIKRLRELNEKATERPWKYEYVEPYESELVGPKGIKVYLDDAPVHDYNAQVDKDAELIALMRNALPDLIVLYDAVAVWKKSLQDNEPLSALANKEQAVMAALTKLEGEGGQK